MNKEIELCCLSLKTAKKLKQTKKKLHLCVFCLGMYIRSNESREALDFQIRLRLPPAGHCNASDPDDEPYYNCNCTTTTTNHHNYHFHVYIVAKISSIFNSYSSKMGYEH